MAGLLFRMMMPKLSSSQSTTSTISTIILRIHENSPETFSMRRTPTKPGLQTICRKHAHLGASWSLTPRYTHWRKSI